MTAASTPESDKGLERALTLRRVENDTWFERPPDWEFELCKRLTEADKLKRATLVEPNTEEDEELNAAT